MGRVLSENYLHSLLIDLQRSGILVIVTTLDCNYTTTKYQLFLKKVHVIK